jgi:hypothetical protein
MTDKTTPEHHAEAILRAAGMTDAAIEGAAKVHCDYFGGEGWWDSKFDAKPEALEAMRLAILSAVREAMEAERKAVVDWLRDDAIKTANEVRSLHARQKLTPLMSAQWDAMVQTKAGVAGSIERGEHLPTPPRGEALAELIASTADQYGDTER